LRIMTGWYLTLASLLAVLLLSAPSQANEYRCFGDNDEWCAWTVPESTPEKGWGTISKVRHRGLVVETVIDAQNNVAALRVRVSPVTDQETASVTLSIRNGERDWRMWRNFTGNMERFEETITHFVLSRQALESALDAPADAQLYVFVELKNGKRSHKVSHKVPVAPLGQALRFARMGGS